MKETNVLVILSDEHTREALGCYGSPFVRTPNLDRIAASGTRFTSAYTPSPLCAPARSSLAAGRYVHQTRCWDNGHPFEGAMTSWASRLRESGHHTVAIGKLHYRDTRPANGFTEEILPMHVRYGIGDIFGLLRKDPPSYGKVPSTLASDVGAGESNHTEYDREITKAACRWLKKEAPRHRDKPWVLFVSLVAPHFPLIAPKRFFKLYPPDLVPWPRLYDPAERPRHPVIQALCRSWNYDDFFDAKRVRIARAAYYGLCSFLDYNIGKVLSALEDSGTMRNTRILYSSDHGEMLGNRGIWSTSVMYEESVGIPMLVSGPGIPRKKTVHTVVSLIDVFPTVIEMAGERLSTSERRLPGRSLVRIAEGHVPRRTVLSEYHAGGSITGSFMVRVGKWKYVHYVGYAPQLFDLEADPFETRDFGQSSDHADVRAQCEAKLRAIVDPDTVNAQAFADQAATIARHGGEAAVRKRGHPGEHTRDRPLGTNEEVEGIL